ncbi:MAG: hypothetical protein KIT45_08135 [Fimbriimonadia bacterium]|nr:hypothetical protein [Fimbriimonadia bacterium]
MRKYRTKWSSGIAWLFSLWLVIAPAFVFASSDCACDVEARGGCCASTPAENAGCCASTPAENAGCCASEPAAPSQKSCCSTDLSEESSSDPSCSDCKLCSKTSEPQRWDRAERVELKRWFFQAFLQEPLEWQLAPVPAPIVALDEVANHSPPLPLRPSRAPPSMGIYST